MTRRARNAILGSLAGKSAAAQRSIRPRGGVIQKHVAAGAGQTHAQGSRDVVLKQGGQGKRASGRSLEGLGVWGSWVSYHHRHLHRAGRMQHDDDVTTRWMPSSRSRRRFEKVHATAMTVSGSGLIRGFTASLFRDGALVSGGVAPARQSLRIQGGRRMSIWQRRLSSALNMQHPWRSLPTKHRARPNASVAPRSSSVQPAFPHLCWTNAPASLRRSTHTNTTPARDPAGPLFTMTNAAQEEFNELMRDKGREERHPEDRHDSDISEPESEGADKDRYEIIDTDDELDIPADMRSNYYMPAHIRSEANTGPKGVIADAQAPTRSRQTRRTTGAS
ncbi:hypothetical protein OPT61_g10413 [Boeremia exigua]|uniref:Uncharacterized protein n=1 Tax=Boeremia exigua TaxID=749465 RepID=A0ACC2HQ05_9PLEO|nr:hypothetical protein OPT61_g10413 [Boeremia exigua]